MLTDKETDKPQAKHTILGRGNLSVCMTVMMMMTGVTATGSAVLAAAVSTTSTVHRHVDAEQYSTVSEHFLKLGRYLHDL